MKKSILQILTCYILWGVLPIFWKTLAELNSLYVLSTRIVWALVFALIIIGITKKTEEFKSVLRDRKQMKQLCLSGIAVAVNWGMYIYAVSSGHILDASLAYYLNPLFAIGLGYLVFHEKLAKRQWAAIAIAATGIIIAIIMYGTIPYFALIIGSSFAIYGMLKKKVTCSAVVSTAIETLLLVPFALICIVVMDMQGKGAMAIMEGAQFCLLPIAGVVTSIPLLAYSAGITKVPMSLSGVLMYINPTLQLLIGVVLYNESFGLPQIIMFVCVWVSLVIFITYKKK